MGNQIEIEPSIKQVRSGKIRKPKKVYVSTTLMEFQVDDERIRIRTSWEIDYDLVELRYIAGMFEMPTGMEPLYPWRVPDRHLRAARSIAAAAFGMKRFRRPVRMYRRLYETNHLFVASHKDKKVLLLHEEDAIIWGQEMKVQPKVEKLPVDTAAKLFDLTVQSAIETAQRMSTLQRSRLYTLIARQTSYISAEKDVEDIKQRGYPFSKVTPKYVGFFMA